VDAWMIKDIVGIGGMTLVLLGVAVGPIGRAIADRLRHGKLPRPGQAEASDDLKDEVESLRLEIGEMQERLDFTERLLAQVKEKGLLEPGGRSDG